MSRGCGKAQRGFTRGKLVGATAMSHGGRVGAKYMAIGGNPGDIATGGFGTGNSSNAGVAGSAKSSASGGIGAGSNVGGNAGGGAGGNAKPGETAMAQAAAAKAGVSTAGSVTNQSKPTSVAARNAALGNAAAQSARLGDLPAAAMVGAGVDPYTATRAAQTIASVAANKKSIPAAALKDMGSGNINISTGPDYLVDLSSGTPVRVPLKTAKFQDRLSGDPDVASLGDAVMDRGFSMTTPSPTVARPTMTSQSLGQARISQGKAPASQSGYQSLSDTSTTLPSGRPAPAIFDPEFRNAVVRSSIDSISNAYKAGRISFDEASRALSQYGADVVGLSKNDPKEIAAFAASHPGFNQIGTYNATMGDLRNAVKSGTITDPKAVANITGGFSFLAPDSSQVSMAGFVSPSGVNTLATKNMPSMDAYNATVGRTAGSPQATSQSTTAAPSMAGAARIAQGKSQPGVSSGTAYDGPFLTVDRSPSTVPQKQITERLPGMTGATQAPVYRPPMIPLDQFESQTTRSAKPITNRIEATPPAPATTPPTTKPKTKPAPSTIPAGKTPYKGNWSGAPSYTGGPTSIPQGKDRVDRTARNGQTTMKSNPYQPNSPEWLNWEKQYNAKQVGDVASASTFGSTAKSGGLIRRDGVVRRGKTRGRYI